ncbi:hypothetical protein HG531_008125 [Fusarium graminearum]|nr:hypothetical protein HG531_008125 [Fusarium graminearum]
MSSNSLLSLLERRPRELSVTHAQHSLCKKPQLESLQFDLYAHEPDPCSDQSYSVERPQERSVLADLFELLMKNSFCAVPCQNHEGANGALASLEVLVQAAGQVVRLEDQKDDSGDTAEELNEIDDQSLLLANDAVVPTSDCRGEKWKVLVLDTSNFVGILLHAVHVTINNREPHLGVRSTHGKFDVTIQTMVIQYDIKVWPAAKTSTTGVLADRDVATVRVAV